MFSILTVYGNDPWASMYATQMHSDSGYLVTSKRGNASYGGYLTWDDHLKHQARNKTAVAVAKELGGCKPFGCATTQY